MTHLNYFFWECEIGTITSSIMLGEIYEWKMQVLTSPPKYKQIY